MDKIRLIGKKSTHESNPSFLELSLDELKSQLKPDLGKLKAGDKVWIEYKLSDWCYYVFGNNIVAYFPSEPEKKVDLPETLGFPVECERQLYSACLGKLIDAVNSIRDYLKQIKEK